MKVQQTKKLSFCRQSSCRQLSAPGCSCGLRLPVPGLLSAAEQTQVNAKARNLPPSAKGSTSKRQSCMKAVTLHHTTTVRQSYAYFDYTTAAAISNANAGSASPLHLHVVHMLHIF